MSTGFLHTKNFKARLVTGILLSLIVVVALLTPNAIMFRILYLAGGVMAGIELFLAQKYHAYRTIPIRDDRILTVEYVILFGSLYALSYSLTNIQMAMVLLGAIATDVSAYFVGSAFHDRLFKKRPFPETSPKKSWEGIIGGYVGCIITLVVSALGLRVDFTPAIIFFIIGCPVASIFGDYIASYCKRLLNIKDSNECVFISKSVLLKKLEKIMTGHGGFLDRVDSISMVAFFMFWIKLLTNPH